jgi:hypothetical protein
MFSELPKLFDRDFVIGFFLPAAVMVGAVWVVLSAFGIEPKAASLEAWAATAVATAVTWLIAVTLLALNYTALRFLEGYSSSYPLKRYRERVWRRQFNRHVKPALDLDREITTAQGSGTPKPHLPKNFADEMRDAVEHYPHEVDFVLASKFGNVFRAAEVYSKVIYGIDAIPMWPRLQAVLPAEFKKQSGEAQSLLNFFVNLMIDGTTTMIVYLALAAWTRRLPAAWIPVVAIVIAGWSYRESLGAVKNFGSYIKSAFDLYRSELAKQLGLELPRSAALEREMWESVSKMMIYRSEREADRLTAFRPLKGMDIG